LFYQFKKNKGDAIATLLYCFIVQDSPSLFTLTNQACSRVNVIMRMPVLFMHLRYGSELAVLYFIDLALKWDKTLVKNMLIKGAIFSALLSFVCMSAGLGGAESLVAGIGIFIVYALVAAGLPYAAKIFSKQKNDCGYFCALSLCVPLLMAQQEWDDHDRSKKQLARDMAKNYLESCAPNAILFTMADNDTYPLWYAQEVEGIRPDVRVVITTLISADWCINQLRIQDQSKRPCRS
jgi:hypothetical protein